MDHFTQGSTQGLTREKNQLRIQPESAVPNNVNPLIAFQNFDEDRNFLIYE